MGGSIVAVTLPVPGEQHATVKLHLAYRDLIGFFGLKANYNKSASSCHVTEYSSTAKLWNRLQRYNLCQLPFADAKWTALLSALRLSTRRRIGGIHCDCAFPERSQWRGRQTGDCSHAALPTQLRTRLRPTSHSR